MQDSGQDAQVNIPDKIKDFSRIKSAIDSQRPLDMSSRVEELKKKIAANEYNIDFEQLADKMLEREW